MRRVEAFGKGVGIFADAALISGRRTQAGPCGDDSKSARWTSFTGQAQRQTTAIAGKIPTQPMADGNRDQDQRKYIEEINSFSHFAALNHDCVGDAHPRQAEVQVQTPTTTIRGAMTLHWGRVTGQVKSPANLSSNE